jgi:hypothetical protein
MHDSKYAEPFAHTLINRRVKTAVILRQVSTLPHRESDGVYFPPFLMNGVYFCGVGAIHLDSHIIAQKQVQCNGMLLQFFIFSFGYFATERT